METELTVRVDGATYTPSSCSGSCGELLGGVMRTERLSADDLMVAAREKDIRRLADVDLAVFTPLETSDGGQGLRTGRRSA